MVSDSTMCFALKLYYRVSCGCVLSWCPLVCDVLRQPPTHRCVLCNGGNSFIFIGENWKKTPNPYYKYHDSSKPQQPLFEGEKWGRVDAHWRETIAGMLKSSAEQRSLLLTRVDQQLQQVDEKILIVVQSQVFNVDGYDVSGVIESTAVSQLLFHDDDKPSVFYDNADEISTIMKERLHINSPVCVRGVLSGAVSPAHSEFVEAAGKGDLQKIKTLLKEGNFEVCCI